MLLTLALAAALSSAQVVEQAPPDAWRPLHPNRTLYMEMPTGRVVIELAPQFASAHIANIKTLVRQRFFDGTTVNRVQENYVTQWGDATEKKPLGKAAPKLPLEAERGGAGVTIWRLPYPDAYAARVGFFDGFPVAGLPEDRIWMAHCYATVGVGRGEATDSGNGTEMYVAIGHAPRHLDRNYTPVGKVLQGMEHLTALPRGTGTLGFYEKPEQRIAIKSVRLASDVPAAERTELQVMRTEHPAFAEFVRARADRSRDGFLIGMGGVDLCNIRVPVRAAAAK